MVVALIAVLAALLVGAGLWVFIRGASGEIRMESRPQGGRQMSSAMTTNGLIGLIAGVMSVGFGVYYLTAGGKPKAGLLMIGIVAAMALFAFLAWEFGRNGKRAR